MIELIFQKQRTQSFLNDVCLLNVKGFDPQKMNTILFLDLSLLFTPSFNGRDNMQLMPIIPEFAHQIVIEIPLSDIGNPEKRNKQDIHFSSKKVFAPDNAFNVIGVTQNDPDHFIGDIGHAVVTDLPEVALVSDRL